MTEQAPNPAAADAVFEEKNRLCNAARRLEYDGRFLAAAVLWGLYQKMVEATNPKQFIGEAL